MEISLSRAVEIGQGVLDLWSKQPGRALFGVLSGAACIGAFLGFIWAWRPIMAKGARQRADLGRRGG